MTVAFVLSGGGTRGAFEVGAAQFLYDVYNIRPDIITATSVGAINGAKLAEGGTPLEKRTALAELTAFWLGLNNERDMWEQAEWLLELGDLAVGDDTLRDLVLPNVTGQPPTIVHAETPFVRANFPWLLDIRALLGGISQLILTLPAVRRKAEQGKLRSILRLRPIEHKMRGIVTTADTSTMGPKDSTPPRYGAPASSCVWRWSAWRQARCATQPRMADCSSATTIRRCCSVRAACRCTRTARKRPRMCNGSK